VVIGDGSERRRLEAQAGPQTRFLGAQPDEVLQDHYRRCRALLFPGVEDFGIVPLEAQASGRPVIALGAGGALETVREGRTGLFFSEATPESLIDALERFERAPTVFAPATCRAQAERFAPERFRAELAAFIQSRTGLTSP
jgi:glycosyltransferase involved in cell wall biosynthesis